MRYDDMNSDMDVCTYTFSYRSAEDKDNAPYAVHTSMNKNVELHSDTAWTSVLREFTHFLSGVYGYDISQQVFLKERGWGDNEDKYYPASEAR